jgi:hypothetical protein
MYVPAFLGIRGQLTMNNNSNKTPALLVVAIFPSRPAAGSAVNALLAAGFPTSDISLFVQAPIKDEKLKTRSSQGDDPIKVGEVGGEVGARLGAAAGALTACWRASASSPFRASDLSWLSDRSRPR